MQIDIGWMMTVTLFLLLACNCQAGQSAAYSVEDDEETGDQVLYFIDGKQQQELYRNAHVTILQEEDFDGNGEPDVLVTTDMGNDCCPPEYAIHSRAKGKNTIIDIICDREPVVVQGPAGLTIRSKTVEKTTIAVLRNGRLETVESIPQLKSIVELHSPEGTPDDKTDQQILKVDINDDGTLEEVLCEHPEFHAKMDCSLPLPNGETQETNLGCERFGMLAAKNNGSHQFVCDNDILFLFDGYRWGVSSPEIEILADRMQKLEPVIGEYPPAIKGDSEKKAVKKEYEAIKAELDALLELTTYDNGVYLLYLRATLQAMGHNFDYPHSPEGATEDFQAVLEEEPHHVHALLALGRLWVNSKPELAPDAENLFLAAQCVLGRVPLEEAQRGLFFAMYYQGRMAESQRQANYLAATWPNEPMYKEMADITRGVIERAKEPVKPLPPLTGPVTMDGCQK